jgi:hypothetical protein
MPCLLNPYVKALRACVFLFALLAASLTAHAQFNSENFNYTEKSDYGFAVGAGIDIPTSGLSDVYKAAPYFDVSLERHLNKFLFGITLGTRSFTPKQEEYTETSGSGSVLALKYGNFTSYMLYGSAVYNLSVSDKVAIFGGVNFGAYRSSYQSSATVDNVPLFDASFTENELYAALKVGLTIDMGNGVALNFNTRANNFFNLGTSITADGEIERLPTSYYSWAGGASVSFRF